MNTPATAHNINKRSQSECKMCSTVILNWTVIQRKKTCLPKCRDMCCSREVLQGNISISGMDDSRQRQCNSIKTEVIESISISKYGFRNNIYQITKRGWQKR